MENYFGFACTRSLGKSIIRSPITTRADRRESEKCYFRDSRINRYTRERAIRVNELYLPVIFTL